MILERIQRDFLLDVGALDNKFHLVKWSSVCKEKGKWCVGVFGCWKSFFE